jgi:hypothetical protein
MFGDAAFANSFQNLYSTSGSSVYWRGGLVAWKMKTQTVRAMSTGESEFINASDLLVFGETCNFLGFLQQERFAVVPDTELAPEEEPTRAIWNDNQSALACAKSSDLRPKSRHYALRWCKVREHSRGMGYCDTKNMRADGLTKTTMTSSMRDMLVFHLSVEEATNGFTPSDIETCESVMGTVFYADVPLATAKIDVWT